MLTNMATIRQSIEKMKWYEESVADGSIVNYTKLEQLKLRRSHDKIEFSLGGIRDMDAKPGAIFIVDTDHEKIAVHEARVLGVPIVGMVDTNCDPDLIDYVIPSNDDATRAIHLIADIMANAVIEGIGIASEGGSVSVEESPAFDESPELAAVEPETEKESLELKEEN
jgi:small subunit ribosomal protein S2